MRVLHVAPIIEGHGEAAAMRTLLQRIAIELAGNSGLNVVQVQRESRGRLIHDDAALNRKLDAAAIFLRSAVQHPNDQGLVLVLIDADDAPACQLGPELLSRARALRRDLDVACVLANPEFETWFVGAATSLHMFLRLDKGPVPDDPETARARKKWVQDRYLRRRYSPRVDQPKLVDKMDLQMCRDRCPSFDKLCRELEKRLAASASP